MSRKSSGGNGRLLKYLFIGVVAVFVMFHFWPKETTHYGKVLANKSARAGKEFLK